jgi:hypothetical protein
MLTLIAAPKLDSERGFSTLSGHHPARILPLTPDAAS